MLICLLFVVLTLLSQNTLVCIIIKTLTEWRVLQNRILYYIRTWILNWAGQAPAVWMKSAFMWACVANRRIRAKAKMKRNKVARPIIKFFFIVAPQWRLWVRHIRIPEQIANASLHYSASSWLGQLTNNKCKNLKSIWKSCKKKE